MRGQELIYAAMPVNGALIKSLPPASPLALSQMVVDGETIIGRFSLTCSNFNIVYCTLYPVASLPCSQKSIAPTDSKSLGSGLLYKAGRLASRHSVTVRLNVRMGKTNALSDFKHGMIVSSRSARSSISETASLLGFSHTTVSLGFTENVVTNKKHPVDGSPVGGRR
jgi:hypothetical protein